MDRVYSYLPNALGLLEADPKYAAFAAELKAALAAIEPRRPDTSAFKKATRVGAPQTCGAVQLSFGPNGELASVARGGGAAGFKGSLGGFQCALSPA